MKNQPLFFRAKVGFFCAQHEALTSQCKSDTGELKWFKSDLEKKSKIIVFY
jgi:hypothetical protein